MPLTDDGPAPVRNKLTSHPTKATAEDLTCLRVCPQSGGGTICFAASERDPSLRRNTRSKPKTRLASTREEGEPNTLLILKDFFLRTHHITDNRVLNYIADYISGRDPEDLGSGLVARALERSANFKFEKFM